MEKKMTLIAILISIATTFVVAGASFGIQTANITNEREARERLEKRVERIEAKPVDTDVAVLKSQVNSINVTVNKIADKLGVVPQP